MRHRIENVGKNHSLYAHPVTGAHRRRRAVEAWTRAHRLSLFGVLLTTAGIMVTLSGIKLIHTDPPQITNNTAITCVLLCGAASSTAQPAQIDNHGKECSDRADDSSFISGYGPPRNSLAADQFSEFPSFNLDSVGKYGDERMFYQAAVMTGSDISAAESNNIPVSPDALFQMQVFIHNSADPSTAATQTRVTVNLPNCTGRRIRSYAYIDGTNTSPPEIWNGVTFVSERPFNLAYVEGSAVMCSNHFKCFPDDTGGVPLSNAFLTAGGQAIGSSAMDGVVTGGWAASIVMYFKVRAHVLES